MRVVSPGVVVMDEMSDIMRIGDIASLHQRRGVWSGSVIVGLLMVGWDFLDAHSYGRRVVARVVFHSVFPSRIVRATH